MKERMEASVEKNNKTITIEVREVSQELEIIKEKPRDTLMVLVPSLAIEYWGRIADMYQNGVRNIYVYSLDKEFFIDFSTKIHTTCPELIIYFFNLEKKSKLPYFDFSLPEIPGVSLDDKIRKFLINKKIPMVKVKDLFN